MRARPVSTRATLGTGLQSYIPVLVAVGACLAYLPSLGGEFVTWDDNRNFLDNVAYRGLGLSELRWMWTSTHMGHYVPLTWMSLGLDYVLWGMNPFGYHLQNVALHALNAVLVFFLARRVFALAGVSADVQSTDVWPSALAALVFAVHPLRVESVAWITERRDMLSLFFYLTSALSYLRFVGTVERPRRWYAASLALFAISLLSKATSMTLPGALLVLNVYPLRRIAGRAGYATPSAKVVITELIPFGLLAAVAAGISIFALHPPAQLTPGQKLAVSAYSLAFYAWKTIWPTALAPLYEMPPLVDPLATRYVVSYGVVAAIAVVAWLVRRRWPGVTAGIAVAFLTILPMLGVVQNGPQIAADRYTYHVAPVLGLLIGAAWDRWRGPPLALRIAVAAGVMAALGVATWRQSGYWRTSELLWGRVLAVDSTSSIAQIAMGDLLIAQGRASEAAFHYGRGVVLDPGYAEGHNNLGVALARDGRFAEAIEHYRQAIAIDSAYADAYNNWGIALARTNDVAGAIEKYETSIRFNPRNADALVNLGNALLRVGRAPEALARYEAADRLRPGNADTHFNWGVGLAQLGRLQEAAQQFRAVLQLDPTNSDAQTYLARVEAAARNR
jgi:Flp pilus assembly protein TadD